MKSRVFVIYICTLLRTTWRSYKLVWVLNITTVFAQGNKVYPCTLTRSKLLAVTSLFQRLYTSKLLNCTGTASLIWCQTSCSHNFSHVNQGPSSFHPPRRLYVRTAWMQIEMSEVAISFLESQKPTCSLFDKLGTTHRFLCIRLLLNHVFSQLSLIWNTCS
jgi:hypothetical protein